MHAALMFLLPLVQQLNEEANSYCFVNAPHAPDEAVWVVDDSIDNMWTTAGRPINNTDILASVDRALQNIQRRSRSHVRHRVTSGTCEQGTNRCIAGVLNAQNAHCEGGAVGTTGKWWPFQSTIRVCVENLGLWTSGAFENMIEHEFGHAFGLEHVDSRQLDICTSSAQCEPAESCALFPALPYGVCRIGDAIPCRAHDFAATANCIGSTNGCSGELMCSTQGCAAVNMSRGDIQGMKSTHPGASTRPLFIGADTLPTTGTPAFAVMGQPSVFAARVDCAKAASGVTTQCAVVRTPSDATIAVHRLNGFTTAGVFTTTTQNHTITLPPGRTVVGSPDVALNSTGTVAWTAWMDSNNGGELRVQRATLSGPLTVAVVAIDEFRTPQGNTRDLQLIGSPRVAFNSDRPNCVQVFSQARNLSTQDPEFFDLFGQRSYHEVCGTTGSQLTVTPFDLDENTDEVGDMVSDYDWDCNQSPGVDTCVIVAHRNTSDAATAGDIDKPWSRRVSFTTIGGNTEPRFVSVWQQASYYTNSILGVSVVLSTNLTPSERLLVAGGRRVTSSTATSNTRLIERSLYGFSGGALADAVTVSDAQTCTAQSVDGAMLPDMSMWGGYSWSFCPSCGSLPGRMISTHFGASDAYCF